MSNILILGKGYIGNTLAPFLRNDRNWVDHVSRNELDYHDINILVKFLLNNDITHVINCSGFTGRPNVDEGESKKSECWNLNVTVPMMINGLCDKYGIRYIHISSGCIYTGYDKLYDESDSPNFGLFDYSSFYSKSKHAFELASKYNNNKIIRIRMPICNDMKNPRNFLYKINRYPKLIDFLNSKTYIPDLCGFIESLLVNSSNWLGQDIYNVVNPSALSTKEVVTILKNRKLDGWDINPEWVNVDKLNLVAPRSNCVLDNTKASSFYSFKREEEFLNLVGV